MKLKRRRLQNKQKTRISEEEINRKKRSEYEKEKGQLGRGIDSDFVKGQ